MLDPVAAERGEKEVDNFVERMIAQNPQNGRAKANEEAARQKAEDHRRLQAMREENRAAWITHLRKSARVHLQMARSARSRARALESGQSS